MKTAVSIPTALFDKAERRARRLGVSRSALYAQALQRLLDDEPSADVTKALDTVYRSAPSAVDAALVKAQRKATAEPW